MLRTNTKKATQNIRSYILDNFTPEGYGNAPAVGADFATVARFVLETFRTEKYHFSQDFQYYHNSEAAAFVDWCQGLPSVLWCGYYTKCTAVDDLGEILEEAPAERERFTEQQAAQMLTYLIYRELARGARQ